MNDPWSGYEYGYDQIGITDPYYTEYGIRYNVNPGEILNINTPVKHRYHEIPYEQHAVNSKCGEMLLNLRNSENKIIDLQDRLLKEKEKQTKRKINDEAENKESFSVFKGSEKKDTIVCMIILVIALCVLIQLQMYENNQLLMQLMEIIKNNQVIK